MFYLEGRRLIRMIDGYFPTELEDTRKRILQALRAPRYSKETQVAVTSFRRKGNAMLNEAEKKEFWKMLRRIGMNLRRARKERKQSQEEFSDILGIDYRYYRKLENGDQPISMRSLFRISRRSKISIKELVQ